MALSLQEQEVHINFNRDEDCAQMYCSDAGYKVCADADWFFWKNVLQ